METPTRKTATDIFLLFTVAIFMAAASIYVKERWSDKNIHISISDDSDELLVKAKFPKSKSEDLHQYLRSKIELDNIDLENVAIKQYRTSDGIMEIYLKSSPGYLKIVLDKHHNTKEAYLKLKELSKGIGHVFTGPPVTSIRQDVKFHDRNMHYTSVPLIGLLILR